MLSAAIVKKAWWPALLLLVGVMGLNPAWAGPPPGLVTVQYRLMTEFAGTEKAGGRIVVSLTNRSSHALDKVTLRLANTAAGKLTGPVQESVQLAAGETRQLEGEFVLDTDVVNSLRPLEWIVVATEPDGFAQQTLVRGEMMHDASMDADARTTSR